MVVPGAVSSDAGAPVVGALVFSFCSGSSDAGAPIVGALVFSLCSSSSDAGAPIVGALVFSLCSGSSDCTLDRLCDRDRDREQLAISDTGGD